MVDLVWSESIAGEADEALLAVRARLDRLGIAGQLSLTGAASVPRALTKGDIDLHLRVPEAVFCSAVAALSAELRQAELQAWAPTLAVFEVPWPRPTGLAVTPAGSEHDARFTTAWALLGSDPALLREYNQLKRAAWAGGSYDFEKSTFFSRITGT